MSNTKQFAACILAATVTITLHAESRCPGNVESLPYRSLNRHQIVVPVSINHSGPYNFLLDTGTQLTMIEPELAAELHLTQSGQASVRSAGVRSSATMAEIEILEAGAHHVPNLNVIVFSLAIQQGKSLQVRGILGEDFLEHFDLLIDNTRHVTCLDDSGKMLPEIKGRHLELLSPGTGRSKDIPAPLIIAVRLSDGMRPVLLELDSGADVSVLFSSSFMEWGVLSAKSLHGNGATAQQRAFQTVPAQNLKVGSVIVEKVPFITYSAAQEHSHPSEYDGLLSLGLFKRVFISHSAGFAALEPY